MKLILAIYVNDSMLLSNHASAKSQLKRQIKNQKKGNLKIKELGLERYG